MRMRLLAVSAMQATPFPAAQGALVDDGVGEATYLEERGNAAHRFGMPQTYEPPRREGLEQVLGCHTPGGVVEVDQHVSAEDDIEYAMLARFQCLGDVGRAELDRLAQFGDDAPAVLSRRHEILLDELGRQPHERPGAVLACGSGRGTLGVDVGADDLDVLDID